MSHRRSRHRSTPVPATRPRMSLNGKLTVGIVAFAIAVVTALFAIDQAGDSEPGPSAAQILVRSQSLRLSTAADDRVTIVEFLDFECPACAVAHSEIDRILAEYHGKITYVVRQFPLPNHRNAEAAARAAQAAALQGGFKAMYDKLYTTQQSWGNQAADHSALFDTYATQLGLEMAKFRADVNSAAVVAQIRADVQDGLAMQVGGTPVFFFNGSLFGKAPTYANFKSSIEAVLNQ